jgi:hypothetical protein
MSLIPFTTRYQEREYTAFKKEIPQIVPEVGLVFSIADNGYGSGSASAYVIRELGPLNKNGFPKSFTASPLAKSNPQGDFNNRSYTVNWIDETHGTCLVENVIETFTFKARHTEAYHKSLISYLNWGRIISECRYDK